MDEDSLKSMASIEVVATKGTAVNDMFMEWKNATKKSKGQEISYGNCGVFNSPKNQQNLNNFCSASKKWSNKKK